MIELLVFAVDVSEEVFGSFREVQDGLEVDDLCGAAAIFCIGVRGSLEPSVPFRS